MKEVNKSTKVTKQKIIASTITLLETKGFFGTTTQAICDMAGVAPGRINYHFGSKDNLIIEVAEMIPTQIKLKLSTALDEEINKNVFINALYFDAMLIKVIFTNNEYMKKYREIYSQSFICNHISDINQQAFVQNLAGKYNLSTTMTRIMAEASAYAITSLAKERNYGIMCANLDLTIKEFLRFQLVMFQITQKNKESLIEDIIFFINKTPYVINGIAEIEFI